MNEQPLRTTVIGSYPFPGWLELCAKNLDKFGPDDLEELQADAVMAAVQDQIDAGLDVITDGEQTRLDFNLSFYGFLQGIERETLPSRRFGPPAHDQRGKHKIVGPLSAPAGLGSVMEFERLTRVSSAMMRGRTGVLPTLKISIPGPYTLSGRMIPDPERYADRWAIAEALLPLVSWELVALIHAGCTEICVDEPSMSCYAHKNDPAKFVDLFNRTIEPIRGQCRLSTHLCFGNYRARAVGPRQYAPMFPAFHALRVDEIHVEMASREFAELEIIGEIARTKTVAVGIIDVKSYYIETVEDVISRIKRCLHFVPPERLALAPDCGLSQTARWAARKKLKNLVEGAKRVRAEVGAKPAL